MDDMKIFMPEKLTKAEQYRMWAILAKLCLENADVLEYIESDVTQPTNSEAKKDLEEG